jgi:hypothetical protein
MPASRASGHDRGVAAAELRNATPVDGFEVREERLLMPARKRDDTAREARGGAAPRAVRTALLLAQLRP